MHVRRWLIGWLLVLTCALSCGGCRTVAAVTVGSAVVGGAVGYSIDHDGGDAALGAAIGVGTAVVIGGVVLLLVLRDAGKSGPYRANMSH